MQPVTNGSIGIIPARLDSTRFPNKILQSLDGIPILTRVILNVLKSETMDHVIVATDSKEIVDFCKELDVETIFNVSPVLCGSERVKHVYEKYPGFDHYVTFPADEALISPQEIRNMWEYHTSTPPAYDETIRTCYSKFYSHDRLVSPKSCKIVSNGKKVMYFSRSVIPLHKNGILPLENYKKHVGIFIFNYSFFRHMKGNPWNGYLSNVEGLEQVAFLENGLRVNLIEIDHPYYGIDTPEDIIELERIMK